MLPIGSADDSVIKAESALRARENYVSQMSREAYLTLAPHLVIIIGVPLHMWESGLEA